MWNGIKNIAKNSRSVSSINFFNNKIKMFLNKQFNKFFKMLLRHVKQGFYGHPRHGGNAGWASYRMLGIAAPSVTGRNIPGKENHL